MKLCIPEKTLAQHVAVLGKTGSGKSSKLRHIVEHLLTQKKRVCIVDPKGDWSGLKTSADGKSAGFPVIGFGDFKDARATDVPINSHSGKHVAELITSGNRPCVIGFRGWMPGAMVKFWTEFASQLFNAQSGELYLVIDEVHNFAPKGKILDPQAGLCIHWTNRLMSEGRSLGLVCLIASQRPQKVHNDTLTCCETLIAARVIHKADRDAIKEWIAGCGDSDKGNEVLNGLAQLERPDAWVWSPEEGFGPKKITFPMFETFDSFAPPQLQKKISQEGWSSVNLDEVKEKLAAVIEEQKANDPAELKREISKLRNELRLKEGWASRPAAVAATPEVIEVPILTDMDRKKISDTLFQLESLELSIRQNSEQAMKSAVEVKANMADVLKNLQSISALPLRASHSKNSVTAIQKREVSVISRPAPPKIIQPVGNIELNNAQQMILSIALMLKNRGLKPDRDMIARWHDTPNKRGIHPNGGTYGSNLASIRRLGLLDDCDITTEGEQYAHSFRTGFDATLEGLNDQCQKIMRLCQDGQQFTRETLAAELGIHANGGTYGQNLALLRTRGLITDRGEITLTEAANK